MWLAENTMQSMWPTVFWRFPTPAFIANTSLLLFAYNINTFIHCIRAGGRAVDLRVQSLQLTTKAAAFKRVDLSLLIGRVKHVDWGGQAGLAL